ncbi:MAG: S8 family peptidase [Actinomycetota bacterium]
MDRRVIAASLAFLLAGVLAGSPGPAPSGSTIPAGKVDPGLLRAMVDAPGSSLRLIVKETMPASDEAEHLVRGLGGAITHDLPIVSGFSASLPAEALPELAGSPAVGLVWGDGEIRMTSGSTTGYDSWSPNTAWRQSIRLTQVEGYFTGSGVTVAVLDTGVSQVPDLSDRVLARVDLTPDQDGFDRYGHGTHMAGIIAGDGSASAGEWKGVAPGANLVSVKVAGADGSTDVSVVIAGLQWVLENKSRYGIRVLNLAFGTDSRQSYRLDPLNYAVEQVWFGGILVVASAGNRGPDGSTINKPGDDPFVLTVGAADLKGTADRGDDVVASFSSWGPTPDGYVKPDVVAPGITIVAPRAVGSTVDHQHPDARVGDGYFKGTGTSQAAAIVSGVAALMYQADPMLTPDEAKTAILRGATKTSTYRSGGGAGLVDVTSAIQLARRGIYVTANLGLLPSNGLGSLDSSRGSFHVYADPDGDGVWNLVEGEGDVLGQPWSATSWSALSWSMSIWASLVNVSTGWTATSWSATSWSGTSWSATSWSATSWSATSWSATSWSSDVWS